jgi:hypothetical protein
MSVFDSNTAGPLLRQFEAANEAEGAAIRAVRAAQEARADTSTIMGLIDRMTEAHNKKMDIWEQLERLRLDK